MARDGLLPSMFASVHPRFKTPHVTTILTGVVVGGIAAFATVDEMVSLTNIGTLFAFILVCVGVMVLRHKDPASTAAVQSSVWSIPVAGSRRAVVCAADLLPAGRFLLALYWLVGAGAGVYFAYGYTRSGVVRSWGARRARRGAEVCGDVFLAGGGGTVCDSARRCAARTLRGGI